MSRAEQRFIIRTTDDVCVASTITRSGDSIEVLGITDSSPVNIPCDEIVSIVRESVLSEDVTKDFLSMSLVNS